ncbi:hypothetical protein JOH51_003014 [Rhizobium leguminosarum]|nr:hypothetical protein [Rhizobium leguminosarum]
MVENVERLMAVEGLSPKEATKKAMRQITGAILGITLVPSCVFVPMAFFPGSTGIIYRQFSLTMVVSNERTQGAEHQHLAAFPWVRLSFDRHSHRSAKSLFPPDRSLCCPSVLEPVSNA